MKKGFKIFIGILIVLVLGGFIVLCLVFDVFDADDVIDFLPFDDALEEAFKKRKRKKKNES